MAYELGSLASVNATPEYVSNSYGSGGGGGGIACSSVVMSNSEGVIHQVGLGSLLAHLLSFDFLKPLLACLLLLLLLFFGSALPSLPLASPQGRNLDWNIPDALRNLTVSCTFTKGGDYLYSGACIVGYVGILTGFKSGKFGVSVNARDHGGILLEDVLVALLAGATQPTTLLRRVRGQRGERREG